MLIISKSMWTSHRMVEIHCSDDWPANDITVMLDCSLNEIKSIMEDLVDEQKMGVLLIDCNRGEFPPWWIVLKIAAFLSTLQDLIKSSLNFTLMYAKDNSQKIWINRVLQIYAPIRPVHIVETTEQIKEFVKEQSAVLNGTGVIQNKV